MILEKRFLNFAKTLALSGRSVINLYRELQVHVKA